MFSGSFTLQLSLLFDYAGQSRTSHGRAGSTLVSDTITVTVDIELDESEMDDALSRAKTVLSTMPNEVEPTITGLNRNK